VPAVHDGFEANVAGVRMNPFANTDTSVLLALGLSVLMIGTSIFILFYHDRKHVEIDQVVDYSFSRDNLRRALLYYRFMSVSMLVVYVLFTISCLLLQSDGYLLFSDAGQPVRAGPIGTSMFAFDLVLRGGFFDVMEHFDLRVTALHLNKKAFWFVWYSFVFRMFFSLTLIKMFISFAWIYGKIRVMRQADHGRLA
jgi:hypothetical protein